MRALIALVLVIGCSGEQTKVETAKAEQPTEKKLDCEYARNLENCWRKATAKLATCLGGKPTAPGKFAKDDPTLCEAGEGVGVKLSEPCDPDGKCEVRHVMLGKGDKKCGELETGIDRPPSEENRGAGSMSLTTAEGVTKIEWDEKQKKVVCADGTTYVGSGDWKKELADCADDVGYQGVPAWSVTTTPGKKSGKIKVPGKLSIEVASMDVLVECEKP